MSSGAEALGGKTVAGSHRTTEAIDNEATEAAVDQEPGVEVALESLKVILPEEPMLVNAQPYGFTVDHERLAKAVNSRSRPNQWRKIETLRLQLGESLPPEITGDRVINPKPVYAPWGGLTVLLPKEIAKSEAAQEELVGMVETTINREIEVGLWQSVSFGNRIKNGSKMLMGTMSVAAATGEGIGLATASHNPTAWELLERGAGGAAGAAILIGTVGLSAMIARAGGALERARRWGDKRASDELYADYRQDYFAEPLISLAPLEDTPEPKIES